MGLLAQFRNVGRRSGSFADDRRGLGRNSGSPGAYAGRNAGTVGIDGDGSHALGSTGRPAHSYPVFSGTNPRAAGAFAARARVHNIVPCDFAGHAAIDFDGKAQSPRYHLSREYGVDPLEMVIVADVMTEHSADAVQAEGALQDLPEVRAYSDETCRAVAEEMATTGVMSMPVVDREDGLVIGRISAQELLLGRRHAVVRESERSRSFQLQARRK